MLHVYLRIDLIYKHCLSGDYDVDPVHTTIKDTISIFSIAFPTLLSAPIATAVSCMCE